MTTSIEALMQRLNERTTERDYHKRVGDMLAARIQVLEAALDKILRHPAGLYEEQAEIARVALEGEKQDECTQKTVRP